MQPAGRFHNFGKHTTFQKVSVASVDMPPIFAAIHRGDLRLTTYLANPESLQTTYKEETVLEVAERIENLAIVRVLSTPITREVLVYRLDRWGAKGPERERASREEAKERILRCYDARPGTREARDLNLIGLGVTSLPLGIFSGLEKLEFLSLKSNQLQALPEGVFFGLVNLRELHLSNNQLRALPEGVFVQLKRLEVLGLSCLQLRVLPEGIFKGLILKKLVVLNM